MIEFLFYVVCMSIVFGLPIGVFLLLHVDKNREAEAERKLEADVYLARYEAGEKVYMPRVWRLAEQYDRDLYRRLVRDRKAKNAQSSALRHQHLVDELARLRRSA